MYTYQKSPTQLAGLQIVFPWAGSIYEDKTNRGLSHLLEHMICRPLRPMEQELQRCGIEFNAYTSTNHVLVYFTGLQEYLAPLAQKLVDLIINYKPNEIDLEVERKIVLQEIGDWVADKDRVFWNNIVTHELQRHPILGYKYDIENVTLDQITIAFNKLYGRFNVRYCGSEDVGLNVPSFLVIAPTPNPDKTADGFIKQQTEESSTSVAIVSRSAFELRVEHSDDVLDVVNDVFGKGLQSPLQERLREELQLVYASATSIYSFAPSESIFLVFAMCSPDKADTVISEVNQLLSNVDKWFTQERFDTVVSEWLIDKKVKDQSPHTSYGAVNEFVHKTDVDGVKALTLEAAKSIFKKMYSNNYTHTMQSFAEATK